MSSSANYGMAMLPATHGNTGQMHEVTSDEQTGDVLGGVLVVCAGQYINCKCVFDGSSWSYRPCSLTIQPAEKIRLAISEERSYRCETVNGAMQIAAPTKIVLKKYRRFDLNIRWAALSSSEKALL